jgi:hypothetical protein
VLILSPYAFTGRTEALTRAQCLEMNAMAVTIAGGGGETSGNNAAAQ